MNYPVAIKKIDDNYHAHLPDFPTLEIAEQSIADCIATAHQAVIEHFIDFLEDNKPLPKASELEDYLLDDDYQGCLWSMVNFDIKRLVGKEIEMTITLHQHLYDKVKNHLKEQNNALDFNEFVINAIHQAVSSDS
ncbi:MAG: type II toxin-antitoxin system HicB family antitoxin [Moraxellaceae bacterium]|nr:type II toxin-antitoxin system HicB family antitoxin [Moraxellaceae bacterium]